MSKHFVSKQISRNMFDVSGNMRKLGLKPLRKISGHNLTGTAYGGWIDGIYCEINHSVTRHMGDFVTLHVVRNDFPSMAAITRYYRTIKASIV